MTERLYYHDSYLTKFSAKVVNRQKEDSCFALVFNKTAFYPTSGGQPHDQGMVNEIPVVKVVDLPNGEILHMLEQDIEINNVDCTISWPTRFDHMQQHTGQHILSQSFLKLTGSATVGFHLSSDYATIDLDTNTISRHQIQKVAQLANSIIYENRPVDIKILEQEEVSSLKIRKQSNRAGPIRIIEIKEFDISACGGTHVKKTGEIGGIFIKSVDRINRGLRIEFICGQRIIESYRTDLDSLDNIAKQLSVSRREAPKRVDIQLDELKSLRKEIDTNNLHRASVLARTLYDQAPLMKSLKNFSLFLDELKKTEKWKWETNGKLYMLKEPSVEILERCELIRYFGEVKVIKRAFDCDENCALIKEIAQAIIKHQDCLVFLGCKTRNPQILFANSVGRLTNLDLLSVMGICARLIGGNGGGSPHFVQGGGSDPKQISKALDLALDTVLNNFRAGLPKKDF